MNKQAAPDTYHLVAENSGIQRHRAALAKILSRTCADLPTMEKSA